MSETAGSISQNPSESPARLEEDLPSLGTGSEIFPRRTLFALALVAAVLLGLLLWTAIAPDNLLFSLVMA